MEVFFKSFIPKVHVIIGELGYVTFLWVFVEMLNNGKLNIQRARIASITGLVLIMLSWIAGGYYYLNLYGNEVRPLIKSGPLPWTHNIFMEAKEHIFIFLPFLCISVVFLLKRYKEVTSKNKQLRYATLALTITIVMLGLAVTVMGYAVSAGVRGSLETGLLTDF